MILTFSRVLVLASLAAAAPSVLAACSTDPDTDDASDESEGYLSGSGKALIGSYSDDSGAFRGLILTSVKAGQANEFIADVDLQIACVQEPCPTRERITGTFTAGPKTLNLRSTSASAHASRFLGRYSYQVQGEKLTLTRRDFAQSLAKVETYCTRRDDCRVQSFEHPTCRGGLVCSPKRTCTWRCGVSFPSCAGRPEEACTTDIECKAIVDGNGVYAGCESALATP